jgi:hypothetical protein
VPDLGCTELLQADIAGALESGQLSRMLPCLEHLQCGYLLDCTLAELCAALQPSSSAAAAGEAPKPNSSSNNSSSSSSSSSSSLTHLGFSESPFSNAAAPHWELGLLSRLPRLQSLQLPSWSEAPEEFWRDLAACSGVTRLQLAAEAAAEGQGAVDRLVAALQEPWAGAGAADGGKAQQAGCPLAGRLQQLVLQGAGCSSIEQLARLLQALPALQLLQAHVPDWVLEPELGPLLQHQGLLVVGSEGVREMLDPCWTRDIEGTQASGWRGWVQLRPSVVGPVEVVLVQSQFQVLYERPADKEPCLCRVCSGLCTVLQWLACGCLACCCLPCCGIPDNAFV